MRAHNVDIVVPFNIANFMDIGEEETEILEGEGNGYDPYPYRAWLSRAEHFLRPGVYPETLVRALQVCLPPGETFIVRQGEAGEDEFEVEEEVTGTAHEGVVQIQEMKEEKDEEQERSEGILKLLVTLLSSCKVDNLDEVSPFHESFGINRTRSPKTKIWMDLLDYISANWIILTIL